MNTWRDPQFKYHTSESHDNASHFRRRMRERVRSAATAKAEAIARPAVRRKATA